MIVSIGQFDKYFLCPYDSELSWQVYYECAFATGERNPISCFLFIFAFFLHSGPNTSNFFWYACLMFTFIYNLCCIINKSIWGYYATKRYEFDTTRSHLNCLLSMKTRRNKILIPWVTCKPNWNANFHNQPVTMHNQKNLRWILWRSQISSKYFFLHFHHMIQFYHAIQAERLHSTDEGEKSIYCKSI